MDVTSSKFANLRSVNHTYSALQKASFLVVVYVLLLFLLPTSKETIHAYNFTMLQFHVISFAIALPSLLVWLAAFIGYSTLRQYANSVRSTPEGKHFERLATGCAWLAWSLPIIALSTLVFNSLAYKLPGFHDASIILTNYLGLLFPLVAFSIIGMASSGLARNARLKPDSTIARPIVLIFLAASVLYCYSIFLHFDLSDLGSTNNPYYLPLWLMGPTMIIPHLYTWFVGLLAAYDITLLSKQVSGLLYRRALRLLGSGLVTIIFSFIAVQYVSGAQTHFGHLTFDYRLVLSVLFRIIGGVGYILIAVGAFKLKKFEEV